MRVRMLRSESLQQAGVERPLLIGEVYDLSDVVAQALVAGGSAVECAAVMSAPETKPMPSVRETKRSRRA